MKKPFIISRLSLLILSVLFPILFSINAYAQPKYVLRVNRNSGASIAHEFSDDQFDVPIAFYQYGLDQTDPYIQSSEDASFWFYVRNDIAPSTVRIGLLSTGFLEATRPGGYENYAARMSFPGAVNNEWDSTHGPTAFLASTHPHTTAYTDVVDVDSYRETTMTRTSNSPSNIVYFDEYPGVGYRAYN